MRKHALAAKIFGIAALAAALALGTMPRAAAQVAQPAAALNGTMRDSSGAVVPGATVTLRNTKTGFEQAMKSNGADNYSLVNINPGRYDVTVTMNGFATSGAPESTHRLL